MSSQSPWPALRQQLMRNWMPEPGRAGCEVSIGGGWGVCYSGVGKTARSSFSRTGRCLRLEK